MKHKKSKATDISPKVKKSVWERDDHRCIICGNPCAMPNSHYIPRSSGGLGIEENVVTMCGNCHHAFDNGSMRLIYSPEVKAYLQSKYPDWDESKLVYDKFSWLKGVV